MTDVHQLIAPSEACRKLGHQIQTRNKQTSGVYEYCALCSMGYEMAMDQMGSEQQADQFVKSLRGG